MMRHEYFSYSLVFRAVFVVPVFVVIVMLACAVMPGGAGAQDASENTPPPRLKTLQGIEKAENIVAAEAESGLVLDIRRDALKEAALSYGARGGLAWRTFQIAQELEASQAYMGKVYDFRRLLIAAPSGLLIEPPVVSESQNAMIIEANGQKAAVAERIYNINANANIVSAPKSWRDYLLRDWGDVSKPPNILRPKDDKERVIWRRLVEQGWESGIEQADQIFQTDLARLERDFTGMVRYRKLLSKGMISAPFALQVNRGVTGGGNRMRVGDSAVQITGKPQLMSEFDQWQPVSQ